MSHETICYSALHPQVCAGSQKGPSRPRFVRVCSSSHSGDLDSCRSKCQVRERNNTNEEVTVHSKTTAFLLKSSSTSARARHHPVTSSPKSWETPPIPSRPGMPLYFPQQTSQLLTPWTSPSPEPNWESEARSRCTTTPKHLSSSSSWKESWRSDPPAGGRDDHSQRHAPSTTNTILAAAEPPCWPIARVPYPRPWPRCLWLWNSRRRYRGLLGGLDHASLEAMKAQFKPRS
ncbi:hypothetical protein SELMODRAFT_419052 [Selaginella moellendorffii]|uniref:Uncharacterized protein n=1 Tax=Selaginella moellendorffii TaxID=88036 RepID=D8S7N9_SELML|nr:hypothetical protein SELMODRAFT_419052 [Selaginella moellendorffii]